MSNYWHGWADEGAARADRRIADWMSELVTGVLWPVQPDVDPFTGLPAHEHGDACCDPECCEGN